MTLEEAIKRYTDNAEYERTHGNLQGCLDFRQLVEWLRELQRYRFEISECKAILDNPTPDVTENDKKRAMYVLQTFPDVRGE